MDVKFANGWMDGWVGGWMKISLTYLEQREREMHRSPTGRNTKKDVLPTSTASAISSVWTIGDG